MFCHILVNVSPEYQVSQLEYCATFSTGGALEQPLPHDLWQGNSKNHNRKSALVKQLIIHKTFTNVRCYLLRVKLVCAFV